MMTDNTNPYRSASTGFQPRGGKNRRLIRRRWREKVARRFVENLSKQELADLKRALRELDESPESRRLRERSGLEVFEAIQRRGADWIQKIRGKR